LQWSSFVFNREALADLQGILHTARVSQASIIASCNTPVKVTPLNKTIGKELKEGTMKEKIMSIEMFSQKWGLISGRKKRTISIVD
jgi:hypothetical protein